MAEQLACTVIAGLYINLAERALSWWCSERLAPHAEVISARRASNVNLDNDIDDPVRNNDDFFGVFPSSIF